MRILRCSGKVFPQGAYLHGRSPGNLEMGFLLLGGMTTPIKCPKVCLCA